MAKAKFQGEIIEFDLGELTMGQARAVQHVTGFTPTRLGEEIQAQNMDAVCGLAWLLLKFYMGKDVSYEDICEDRFPVRMTDIEIIEDEPKPAPKGAAKTSRKNA